MTTVSLPSSVPTNLVTDISTQDMGCMRSQYVYDIVQEKGHMERAAVAVGGPGVVY